MEETGKYFEANQDRLGHITDAQWAVALAKCADHTRIRLKKWTTFGAHTELRLGVDAIDYYTHYAYESILSGRWQWKADHSLAQQMIAIADSTMSTEVEKTRTGKEPKRVFDDLDLMFYEEDPLPENLEFSKEVLIAKQIEIIEDAIRGDPDLEIFWECVKDGMKRSEIAAFMEISVDRHDKFRDRLLNKVRKSPYFEMD